MGYDFTDQTVFISGGTGSFGRTIAQDLLTKKVGRITIFSRDEKKQDDFRCKVSDSRLNFVVGDVRDSLQVRAAMAGANKIFHAAALKQVPSCEFHPMEAVKTNILGTENVLNAGVELGVDNVVVLSTDKAVYPVNAMGISKAMMEKLATAKARYCLDKGYKTKINITRYGNVMGSRGSVLPLFIKLADAGAPLSITHPSMTRFLMSLEDAMDLVYFAFSNASQGDLVVKKAPACDIKTIGQAINELRGRPSKNMYEIGIRHGEKLHETLCSAEEMLHSVDHGEFYTVPADFRDLNFESKDTTVELVQVPNPYTSENTRRLDKVQIKKVIQNQNFYKNFER
jgi:UDP-glucose 4-epimerase